MRNVQDGSTVAWRNSRRWCTAALGLAAVCVACGDSEEQAWGTAALAIEVGPSEFVKNGVLYKRSSSLGRAELNELTDRALWEHPITIEKLAQLMRAYVVHPEFGEYVEAAPNYELARLAFESLEAQQSISSHGGSEMVIGPDAVASNSPSSDLEGPVDKAITANGDQRSITASVEGILLAQAFYQHGGSGTLLPGKVIYTAGHVLYNNDFSEGPNGWYCEDGDPDNAGVPCNIGLNNRLSGVRFGGRILNINPNAINEEITWASGFFRCGTRKIPNGWRNMPGGTTSRIELASWDYGAHDVSGCVPNGYETVGYSTNMSQATMRTKHIRSAGYPLAHKCPAGSIGNLFTDCVYDGGLEGWNQYRPNNFAPPYVGANVAMTVSGPDSDLLIAASSIQTWQLDVTEGQSGSALLTYTFPYWYVVGTANYSGPAVSNYWNYLTTSIKDWLYQ